MADISVNIKAERSETKMKEEDVRKGVGVTKDLYEEESERKDKIIREHESMLDMFKKVSMFETALKLAFGSSNFIATKKISWGGTSAQIFLPKKFHKKFATVIVWDEDRFND